MIRLFESSEVLVPEHPENNGFYDLELPDAFRWMKQEAECWLVAEKLAKLSTPALRITANALHGQSFLSVRVGGDFLGTERIAAFGSYYFHVAPSALLEKSGLVRISLRVDHAEANEHDPRMLGIPIYGIDAIDLNSGWDAFEERRYLGDQVKVFRAGQSPLPGLLESLHLGQDSLALDVGAGMGWSTVLLAAKTGARVCGVDLHQYDSFSGDSFRGELLGRLKRHLPALATEPGLERFRLVEQVVDACTFYTMDAQRLLFRDGLFDIVFSLNAFEHIPDPWRALQEISRVLKPGGHAFLQFTPIYCSDSGHHLFGLTDIPWIHLLYKRTEIKKIILDAGKIPNEVDHILNSLNGYTLSQYSEMLDNTDLQLLDKQIHKGFSITGAERSQEFEKLKASYPEEDLTTLGMTIILQKKPKTNDF